jgi:hypothetical protein
MALHWLLFASSAWAQPASGLADTTDDDAPLGSDRIFGVGSANDIGGGHDS